MWLPYIISIGWALISVWAVLSRGGSGGFWTAFVFWAVFTVLTLRRASARGGLKGKSLAVWHELDAWLAVGLKRCGEEKKDPAHFETFVQAALSSKTESPVVLKGSAFWYRKEFLVWYFFNNVKRTRPSLYKRILKELVHGGDAAVTELDSRLYYSFPGSGSESPGEKILSEWKRQAAPGAEGG